MRPALLSIFRRGTLLAGSLAFVAACSSAGSSGAGYGAPLAAGASSGGAVAAASASPGGGYYGGSPDSGGSSGGGRYGDASGAPAVPANGSAEVVVNAVAMGTAGAVLTGADGRTLYVFKKDGPDKSACSGGCAGTWPALTLQLGQTLKPGSTLKGTLGTFTRSDGSVQVTLDKAPLYYFSGDSKAGDMHGQGIGGVWFAAVSGGAKVAAASPGATSAYGY